MNKTFVACLLLLLPFGVLAAVHPVSEADLAAYKELAQTRLDAAKESLQKDREKTEVRLDNQDKRIGDMGLYLSLFGGFLTVLVLIAGWVGLTSVRSRAREEAREAADQWFEGKGLVIKAAAFETQLAESHESILKLTTQVEELAERTGMHFEDIEKGTRQHAETMIARMQEEMSHMPEKNRKTEPADATHAQLESKGDAALEQLDEAARSKPEIEYDYNDWNARAFNAWNKNYFDIAAHYWAAAASVKGATYAQVAQALVNKGFALGKLNRIDEAMDMYDEVVSRYDNAPEVALREEVARAKINKSAILGQLNRNEELIAVSENIESRYGSAPEEALRLRVAQALYNKGLALGKLNRIDEAMDMYDEVVSRYDNAPEVALRDQVARAKYIKGGELGKLNRIDEAMDIYDEVLSRYGSASEAEFRDLIAIGLNNKGFLLLCRAKAQWSDEAARLSDLQAALTLFVRAEKDMNDKPFVWGNQAYTTFLLGQLDAARSLLKQALQQGGEELYKNKIDDLNTFPVPLAADFLALLEELWAEVGKSGTDHE